MSILVRGLPGVRRSRNVHFCTTSSRCQRNNVAGETNGSGSRSTFDPISLASAARVRRSESVNTRRRRPSRARSSRFSAFRYSTCAPACRSSQQPIVATRNARKVRGFHDMRWRYEIPLPVSSSSFRTIQGEAGGTRHSGARLLTSARLQECPATSDRGSPRSSLPCMLIST